MPSLALELYQVLEDEYVSMYGPLDRISPLYAEADILNPYQVRVLLKECPPLRVTAEDAGGVAAQLSQWIQGQESLTPLAESPAISDRGKRLLASYDELQKIAEDNGGQEGRQELRRTILDDALTGAVKPLRDARLDRVYTKLHERAKDGKPRSALCISGGGIRSATFALGVMQGLASANLLDKFDYLSTVSGGGYIGSWLSSWIRRHGRGATAVQGELQRADTAVATSRPADAPNDAPVTPRTLPQHKLNPEPVPLRHLRAYSNYLSPRLGLLSGDSWTMASLYVRNLLLNLLVLVPLLAFALSFPRIFSWILLLSKDLDTNNALLRRTVWVWIAAVFIALGFGYLGQKRPVAQGEKAQKKTLTVTTDGRFLLFGVLPLVAAATSLAVFWGRVKAHPAQNLLTHPSTLWAAGLALVSMTIVPFLLYYRRVLGTRSTEQKKSFAAAAEQRKELWRKLRAEGIAEIVALATTGALLWLLAEKVFDDPQRIVPTVETLAPILRAGQAASPQAQLYVCFAVPLLLLVFFAQASIFVGLSSFHNEDYDREWWGRAGAWLLAIAVGLALLNTAAVFGPVAFYYAPVILASVGGAAGVASALLGFSGKTPANQREKEEGGTTAKAGNLAAGLTVPLFVVALLAAISLGTTAIVQLIKIDAVPFESRLPVVIPQYDGKQILQPAQYEQAAQLQSQLSQPENALSGLTLKGSAPRVSLPALRAVAHLQTIQQTGGWEVLSFVGIALVSFALSFCIGVNKFSMHALYRNRLIRAYLGASRYVRDPDHFTGFDENDNLKMWELRPELLWYTSLRDVEGFLGALQNPQNLLGAYLWSELEPETKDALKTVHAVSIQALVENLNDILLTCDLTASGVSAPAWTAAPGKIGYSRAMINRAILDQQFQPWITAMAPPADALDAEPELRRGPLHIVNTALNLTSGENLAWQQRMAESFTVSPYHSGSLFLGYRPSREYGGEISLGTAVTISGAAASPNMGYHSSPLMAFLLTFFNIRLGSWLGNPGPHGEKTYGEKHPTTGLVPLFSELTGNSTDRSKWVYLSDGGHFENLALYEMVVRRCHRIVLSDGGADPQCSFEDLGNAIRKIRTDLGIPIEIAKFVMAPRAKDGKPVTGDFFAFATIRYSAVDRNAKDGKLIYIKPGIYVSDYLPWDVYNYAQESLEFPHEPTSDQFFSESQFESYRALGRHAVNELCKSYPITKTYASIDELFNCVRPQW